MTARIDLVIFDLDGTLVDSEPIANRVLHEHLVRLGLPLALPEAEALFTGRSLPDCYRLAEERFGLKVPPDFTTGVQAETFARLHAELRPMPGAATALAAIDHPKCVASGSEPGKIRLELDVTGLRPFFADTALFSAYQVARGKPAPDLFLHAARAFGVAPERCAVIEDSGPGVAAGLEAGMQVFAFRHPATGVVRFDDLADLPRLLD